MPLTNRATGLYGYTDNLRTPYIQSFNATIQRELTSTLTSDLNYIGNKGSRLYVNQQINDTNIFENGILTAFNAVRAGGDSPLFDRMLNGLAIPGVGTVNNSTLTGRRPFASTQSRTRSSPMARSALWRTSSTLRLSAPASTEVF